MKIRKNIKLAKYTTFHVGGPAEFFAEVKNVDELKEAVSFARKNKLKIFVLGGGSNVLISDKGIDGLVLKINIKEVRISGTDIYAGAGEEWDKVVARAVSRGLGGIENLSLIPGTVGGAVYQNIGAYGAEIKDVLEFVDVFDVKLGEVFKLSTQECQFEYRTSVFQKPEGGNYIILGASLKLSRNPTPNTKYPDLIKYFEGNKPLVKEIRNAVIKIRRSKLVYPSRNTGTVGSFFKNPITSISNFQFLISKYPDLKGRETKGQIKLSAGQLIELAGCKGRKIKNVGVSEKHALVLVSYPGAKSENILKLAELIQKAVKTKFGVQLEPEVKIMP